MMQKENRNTLSETIEWLRFPLIVGVVLIHSAGSPPLRDAIFDWSFNDSMIWYHLFRYITIDLLSRASVPAFFIISGFVFFYYSKDWNKEVYIAKMKRRAQTLLVPYLIWNLIGAAYLIYQGRLTGIGDFLCCFWAYYPNTYLHLWPADIPLWYIRDLMVLSMISPIIHYLIKRFSIGFIIIAFIIFILSSLLGPEGASFSGLFFFSFGAYFGINKQNMFDTMYNHRKVIFLMTLVLLVFLLYFRFVNQTNEQWLFDAYVTFITFSILIVAHYLVGRRIVKDCHQLTRTVFFVFAFHNLRFVSSRFTRFSNMVLGIYDNNAFIGISSFLLTAIGKIILSILIFEFLRRTTPRVLSILVGNRTE